MMLSYVGDTASRGDIWLGDSVVGHAAAVSENQRQHGP